MKQLLDDDAQALDLILEQGLHSSYVDGVSADPQMIKRVGVVESVLRVLNELPEEDPPHDLVARTLAYVYAGSSGAMPDASTGLNG